MLHHIVVANRMGKRDLGMCLCSPERQHHARLRLSPWR